MTTKNRSFKVLQSAMTNILKSGNEDQRREAAQLALSLARGDSDPKPVRERLFQLGQEVSGGDQA
jgi:hypothetical protein